MSCIPSYLRDTLLRLASAETYRASWSQHILKELEDALAQRVSREAAARVVLKMSEHSTEIDDPVGPLQSAGVSEEALRPILRLLLVESLVGSRRASRIIDFRLGPPRPDGCRQLLGWQSPGRDEGEEARQRLVEGTVDI